MTKRQFRKIVETYWLIPIGADGFTYINIILKDDFYSVLEWHLFIEHWLTDFIQQIIYIRYDSQEYCLAIQNYHIIFPLTCCLFQSFIILDILEDCPMREKILDIFSKNTLLYKTYFYSDTIVSIFDYINLMVHIIIGFNCLLIFILQKQNKYLR